MGVCERICLNNEWWLVIEGVCLRFIKDRKEAVDGFVSDRCRDACGFSFRCCRRIPRPLHARLTSIPSGETGIMAGILVGWLVLCSLQIDVSMSEADAALQIKGSRK